MSSPPLIAVVRSYLDLLEQGTADASIAALAEALDRLALACHAIGEAEPVDEASAPRSDYQAYRRLAEQRFPDLGYYNDAPILRADIGTAQLDIADAIDDLADIACELAEVRWLWEHAGPGAAAWQYKFSYQTHFGRHLHSLRRYVHDLMSAP